MKVTDEMVEAACKARHTPAQWGKATAKNTMRAWCTSQRTMMRMVLEAAVAALQPIGYLNEKSGINNGHYFTEANIFEHIEPRFRHLYTPVYAGVAPEKVDVD